MQTIRKIPARPCSSRQPQGSARFTNRVLCDVGSSLSRRRSTLGRGVDGWYVSLTTQRFRPKLRLIIKMQVNPNRTRLGALLLGLFFLAAQFHFCADLNSRPSSAHPCQLCSTAGSAIATDTLNLSLVPVVDRLEVFTAILSPFLEVSSATSPRAPPSL